MAEKTTKSENDKIMFFIAYILPVISGILIYVLYADKDKRLKFHAVQAIIYWIVAAVIVWILEFLFVFFFFLLFLIPLLWLLVWIYAMYIAYQAFNGTDMEVPYIGEMAKKA